MRRAIVVPVDLLHLHQLPDWLLSAGEDIMMFTAGVRAIGGHAAGDHDGIRDGASSAAIDWSGNRKAYCTRSTYESLHAGERT